MKEYNEIVADLNYESSYIKNLQISNNCISITNDSKKQYGLDIVPIEYTSNDKARYISLEMKIIVYVEENEKLSKIDLEIVGAFSAPISMPEETFKKMSLINGGAALYSIARGKIENLTAMTYKNGKITLPMVNIMEYYKSKAE